MQTQPLSEHLKEIKQGIESSLENTESYLQILRFASIGELVGEISHTFNNILGGILGYAQLIKAELSEESDLSRQIAIIEQASKRASKLLSQLQFCSQRGEAKRVTDPKTLVDDLYSILASFLNKNITVETKYEHGSARISVDTTLIFQALLAICRNCKEAMLEGGTLTIHTYSSQEEFVVFEISDTGVGIPKSQLQHIFEPFFSTKTNGLVNGLGLSVAEAIIKSHHGQIEVESQEGKGTTFRIYLPVVRASTAPTAPKREVNHVQKTGQEVILVVEDEEELRLMAQRIFEKRGFRVLVAGSGDKAIETFEQHADEIKLVILDMILPGGNGEAVYKEIKKMKKHPKVILTSGYPGDAFSRELIVSKSDSFLQKPWDVPQLIEKAENALAS